MFVYIFYIYMYIHKYMYYMYLYIYMYSYVCLYMYIYMWYIHTHTYTYCFVALARCRVCKCACLYIYIRTCVYAYTHTFESARRCTCTKYMEVVLYGSGFTPRRCCTRQMTKETYYENHLQNIWKWFYTTSVLSVAVASCVTIKVGSLHLFEHCQTEKQRYYPRSIAATDRLET